MANIVIRKRRGTTSGLSGLVMQLGDIWTDTTKKTLVVGDGTTAGGVPLAKEVHAHASATTMTAGFMSSADKTKLDALSLNGGIQNILSITTPVAAESTANFNSDFTVVDNPGASRTDFAISTTFRNEVTSNAVALIVALS
jgi:major tropism determinant Mtd-like protein